MSEQSKQDAQQPLFQMEKIYLKDVSFESPNAPQVFSEQATPEINIQLNIGHTVLNAADGLYEVVLTTTVNTKDKSSGKSLFLVEVQQAGGFRLKGIKDSDLPLVLEITCPNILFPFAREAVNELVVKGGFPQLLINPVNFEVLYQQKHGSAGKQAQQ